VGHGREASRPARTSALALVAGGERHARCKRRSPNPNQEIVVKTLVRPLLVALTLLAPATVLAAPTTSTTPAKSGAAPSTTTHKKVAKKHAKAKQIKKETTAAPAPAPTPKAPAPAPAK
jgi:hypothetical protein